LIQIQYNSACLHVHVGPDPLGKRIIYKPWYTQGNLGAHVLSISKATGGLYYTAIMSTKVDVQTQILAMLL